MEEKQKWEEKRAIKSKGLSQETFAEAFGTTDRTVRRWISGGVDSLTLVSDIANFFGVSVGDVIFGEDDVHLLLWNIKRLCRVSEILCKAFFAYFGKADTMCPVGSGNDVVC